MTHEQAFTKALVLAITAPNGREDDALALVYQLSGGLSPQQVEACKAQAMQQLEMTHE
jgi:hypothetical protein